VTQRKQQTKTRKKNKMAQKKEPKNIKIRDLKPKKDAKGGGHTSTTGSGKGGTFIYGGG
jgi:hypothetical protein